MITTSVGLFDGFSQVVRAIEILQGCGFSREELSIITLRNRSTRIVSDVAVKLNSPVDKRRLVLPVELSNFVAEAQSLFVKGIGQVAMAGPLAFILTETMDNTQSGDLLDALGIFEISEEEAQYYAEGVRRGGILLTVTAADHLTERAEDVLLLHGAIDVLKRAMQWREQGWHHFNPALEPFGATELEQERQCQIEERKPGRDWNPYERDFRSHFYLTYSDDDVPYDSYASAYRYGYQLASDDRYNKRSWDEIETQVRYAWEKQNKKAWIAVADAISYGFLRGRENYMYRASAL